MPKTTVVFTGGHHNSSLVVAKELQKEDVKIVWIGHKYSMSGDKKVSAEFSEVTKNKIPFFELKTGKIYRKFNPFEYIKVFFGFFQAFAYLIKSRPKLIVSFGGYLSVPVVIAGWMLHIPTVTHEQTVTGGWANRVVALFAKKIFISHESSLSVYPTNKTVLTGLPIRKGLLTPKKKLGNRAPLIYITCGKQGSHIINSALFPLIPSLVEKYRIIHQTGSYSVTNDQDKARRIKASLPLKLRSRYVHKAYFFETEATRYLRESSLIISRAGAHTTYEILVLNKKAVLIPISWASHNEQYKNAELVSQKGLGVILQEDELTPEKLQQKIDEALKLKIQKGHNHMLTNATEKIVAEIKPFIS